jgi:hypothetical protein
MQWLQHIKDTPVADLEDAWVERANSGCDSLSRQFSLHDALSGDKLPPAKEQQLYSVLQLLCATNLQLLKQAQELAVKQQQLHQQEQAHGQAASSSSSSSSSSVSSSSSSSSSSATDPGRVAGVLLDLLLRLCCMPSPAAVLHPLRPP